MGILRRLKYKSIILRISYHRVNPQGKGHNGIEYDPTPKGVHVKTLILPIANMDVGMSPT